MTYAGTYDVAVDADHTFRKQLAGALHSIATDIMAEDPDRKSTRLNSSHAQLSRMPSSA